MKIGIDLTWLKPKKSGGVESYTRNLLDGFTKLEDKNEYVLLVAKDNEESLEHYCRDKRFTKILCNTKANNVKEHLIWQNLFEYRLLKKNNIDFCFFPVYEMPLYKCKKIKNVTTIQDIQACHYPEYFSKLENIWFRLGWKTAILNSNKIVATTDYTKQDIMNNFKHKNNIVTINIPIILNDFEIADFNEIKEKYNIKENEYYYTVCSMHKHKNLITLIKLIKEIKDNNYNIPNKLVISGVGGPNKDKLLQIIKEMNIEDNIIITNFVSNEERNSLIKNSNIFLFPSIFEGFGMPPIEAMALEARVLTTKCTSLPEVTKGKCNYVNDPFDIKEWILEIEKMQNQEKKKIIFDEYNDTYIARKYLDLFYEIKESDNNGKKYR